MPKSVSIRLGEPQEKSVLEAVQRRSSMANEGDREALLANPDAIELPTEYLENRWTYVAETEGVIAGFAVVLPREDGDAELDGLFVEPELWKRGIGRRLVLACSDHARASAAEYLHVVGNFHAEEFYIKCGFERYGITQTRFSDALLMRKTLVNSFTDQDQG